MEVFRFTKQERSFIKYDVGNSAFTLMSTVILPIYFASVAQSAGVAKNISTAYWGYTVSISTLILALIYPLLGSIADFRGNKKKLFFVFFVIGVVGNLVLSLTGNWMILLTVYVVGNLGYSGSLVFYDSMITDVTTDKRMDRVSTAGYAWGYIGSCVPFILGIALILTANKTGLGSANATRISFLITAVWWTLFTIPLLKDVNQTHYKEKAGSSAKQAFSQLFATMKAIGADKPVFIFMLSYFFYIDGVHTIISMATKYGDQVGLNSTGLILALLLTQFVAFPFSILAGVSAKKHGTRRMLILYIIGYLAITIFAVFLKTMWQFWVLATTVGICQGGIQALSRSYFGKLIPKDKSNEYFGFFDIFGKYASIMGTVILAVFSQFNMAPVGVACIALLFIAAIFIFLKVPHTAADEPADTAETD